ncbi:uncharacterized protein TNCV_2732131 [Trichonephila clavipes]|nr:uncharacterized protein TNCV_2732131 [Trichonephila clavipes]
MRGLADRLLFKVPPCREGTIHLQTSMSSPGFKPSPNDALFICYKQSPGNAHSVAFSQRSSSPCLFEDETFNDSNIMNNLIDYEDGQKELDFLRVDKNMQRFSFPTNWKSIFFKLIPIKKGVAGSTPAQVSGFSRCRKSTAAMSYDYAACKKSLGVPSAKLNSFVQIRIVRAQVPPSGEETCGNWYTGDEIKKSDTRERESS